ncbi:GGDEF domain-containing protein [Allobacillus sp. GCM10007491]|uniref:Diguanylate cyclase n=1 Tax=Allobacillus saliphilus TaxID=2912308 RepID=A0A941HTE2_9BACI|nr:GGDEF domain-containing protein [Allobacillus saliphilus]MBR7553194.1 diguanylate cyclase [Allobacillus saliphilus]
MIYTDNFRKSEQYFSIVRWLIFIGVTFLVYYSTYLDYLKSQEDLFLYFIGFAFVYTLVIQVILWIKPLFHKFHRVFAVVSVGMDLLAILWLVLITGGVNSLFSPFLLLVIIHGLIYWRLIGFLFIFGLIFIGFTGIWIFQEQYTDGWHLWVYGFHMIFLALVGISLFIVTKQRKPEPREIHYFDDAVVKDPLTGLYNHRSFHNTTEKLIQNEWTFSLILIDIDEFDHLNQKYGYIIGDHILTAFGHTLRHSISRNDGYCFRYGGEDFAVLAFSTDLQEIQKAITFWNNDFNTNLESIKELEGEQVTLSYGIAINEKDDTKEDLLNRATNHLRLAKQKGKNQIVHD